MAERMETAAEALIETLDEAQRQAALLPFNETPIRNWHYVPRRRPGLALKHMREPQRALLWRLIEAGLSAEGARKARDVTRLEKILGEIEGRPEFRDPLNYAVSIFGHPRSGRLWGWRFEGHHLSLTFIMDGEGRISTTPIFFGANRQTVPRGHNHAGLRILPEEEDLGFALVNGLATPLLERTLIGDASPGDIITGPGREASLGRFEGTPLGELDPDSFRRAERLLAVYVGHLREDLRAKEEAKIREAGIEHIHFAWAGSLAPGREHYYRLQGPGFVIEYENSQNDANHCHSVWHNPLDQFGQDLLRAHHHHHHHHG